MHEATAALRPMRLEPRYFERMAASLGDKARMLPWVSGPRVLDIGAGGGELALAIAELGAEVWALDVSPDALDRLRSTGRLRVLAGLADEVPALVGDLRFDVVICSAVLHEVYSYGTSTGSTRWNAVDQTLRALRSVLNPTGRLILRDGIMPDRPDDPAIVDVPDDGLVRDYLARSPHPEVQVTHVAPGRWAGTRHAVAELLCTLTWGRDSLEREALERYQLFTLDGAEERFRFGFEQVHADAVTQPGYRDELAGYTARDADGIEWFPPTNGLWVFDAR